MSGRRSTTVAHARARRVSPEALDVTPRSPTPGSSWTRTWELAVESEVDAAWNRGRYPFRRGVFATYACHELAEVPSFQRCRSGALSHPPQPRQSQFHGS